MQVRTRPYCLDVRLRPASTGHVFYTANETGLPNLQEGGLRRLTVLNQQRLRPVDVCALVIDFGPGWVECWAFEDGNERPYPVVETISEERLRRAGLTLGANARGERAWRHVGGPGEVTELVQLGWVDLLAGQRRQFVARVPRWRVTTARDWRVVLGPGDWAETLNFLGGRPPAAGI